MKIAYRKMNTEEKNSLMDAIAGQEKGIFVFDGPSGSGKTQLLNGVLAKCEKAKRLSHETFTENLLAAVYEPQNVDEAIEKAANIFEPFGSIGVEDIDFQGGRPITLNYIARVSNLLAQKALIIFTGIDVQERVPMLVDNLQDPQIIYFE